MNEIRRRLPATPWLAALAFALPLAGGAALAQGKPGQPLNIGDLLKEGAKTPAKPAPAAPADKAAAPKLDRKAAIARVNAFLNGIGGMSGDFVQVGGDGRRFAGKLYLQKPGRVRFEYDPPSSLEVISDGRTVAVRDRRLNTQDNYFIGQTPLKFLVQDRYDIERDSQVLDVATSADAVSVTLEDKATLGGTSRIRLTFDPETFVLKQWTVRDPQGTETRVSLANLDMAAKPNPKLFTIPFNPVREDKR